MELTPPTPRSGRTPQGAAAIVSANRFTTLGCRQRKRQETSTASAWSQQERGFDAAASGCGLARCQPTVNNVRRHRGEHLLRQRLVALARCWLSRGNDTGSDCAQQSQGLGLRKETQREWTHPGDTTCCVGRQSVSQLLPPDAYVIYFCS